MLSLGVWGRTGGVRPGVWWRGGRILRRRIRRRASGTRRRRLLGLVCARFGTPPCFRRRRARRRSPCWGRGSTRLRFGRVITRTTCTSCTSWRCRCRRRFRGSLFALKNSCPIIINNYMSWFWLPELCPPVGCFVFGFCLWMLLSYFVCFCVGIW